jgi:hypothetical protein
MPIIVLFGTCQLHIHPYQYREHGYRNDGWPLQQEAEHDHHEANVLWMTHSTVQGRGGKAMRALRVVQHTPDPHYRG